MSTTFEVGFDKALGEAQGEQSKDQATPEPVKEAEAQPTPPPAEDKGAEAAQPEITSDELLSKEEYAKLKDDPQALRKALHKSYTQKTQELSEQRKALEPYKELIDGFNSDPQGTVKALAEQLGIKLEQVETKAEVKDAADKIADILTQHLGPDLEFLAPRLSPAIKAAVQELAAQQIAKEVEPLKQQTQKMQEESVKEQIQANLAAFTEKHPDWKKYETDMTKLSQRFQPTGGKDAPTWMEYMEDLYYLATKDTREADITKKTVERMTESAKKSENSEGGVSGNRVTKSAPKGLGFNEAFNQAFNDAKAGTIYDS